jgi:hypothetical protein
VSARPASFENENGDENSSPQFAVRLKATQYRAMRLAAAWVRDYVKAFLTALNLLFALVPTA